MVYISGEEMTNYASKLIVESWIEPYFDTGKWEEFDLSCVNRDKTDDQVRLRKEAFYKGFFTPHERDVGGGGCVLNCLRVVIYPSLLL